MKILKWFMPLGMIAVFSFIVLTIFGKLLRPGYSYIRSYVSVLIEKGAPNAHLMRVFMLIYTICFFLFSLAVLIHAFKNYRICLKLGYAAMFIVALTALIGYGTVPIGMEFIFAANDLLHLLITMAILCLTVLALILISVGYLKQEHLYKRGTISLVATVFFILLNLWHIWAILSGQKNLGLIEWLTFYSFHVFTISVSGIYTFKYDEIS